ncbi:hypothetical protein JOC55_005599 [Paenibacillus sacheonensis]|nr:hypothetical protein [Paenibacillus sacheonensis]
MLLLAIRNGNDAARGEEPPLSEQAEIKIGDSERDL